MNSGIQQMMVSRDIDIKRQGGLSQLIVYNVEKLQGCGSKQTAQYVLNWSFLMTRLFGILSLLNSKRILSVR
ncbi:MAG: hypothetical protein O2U61_07200, partial [Candidatus Bathyarchaeota archaeon]|nr:hypothetical protein [Candidatus Bathyarchaeota archaeon]